MKEHNNDAAKDSKKLEKATLIQINFLKVKSWWNLLEKLYLIEIVLIVIKSKTSRMKEIFYKTKEIFTSA